MMVDGWRLIRFSCSFVTTVHLTPCVSIDLLIWAHRIDCVRPLAVVCHPATYYHHHFGKIFIKDVRGRVAADNDFICRHVLLLSLHSKRGKQQKEILSATHRLKLDATKIENQTRKFVLLPLWHTTRAKMTTPQLLRKSIKKLFCSAKMSKAVNFFFTYLPDSHH